MVNVFGDIMRYNGKTLARTLLEDGIIASATFIKNNRSPLREDDPIMCESLKWLQDRVEENPSLNLDDICRIFPNADIDRALCAAGALRDMGDKINPELRSIFISELYGDHCTRVARECRGSLTNEEKEQLRSQFRTRVIPSTDLEAELK
jgi:hypothetical protein